MNINTRLVHVGREREQPGGFVNPPIYRGSTVIYRTLEEVDCAAANPLQDTGKVYGRIATPSSRAFESAMATLEEGYRSVATSSGLSAISTALQAFGLAGDHFLVTDSAYLPTKRFCESLRRFGIETEYYDPKIGKGIESLIRPNTRLVFLESPGSITFEVQDIPAITQLCRARGVTTLVDNTWATPLYLKPIRLGADISIHSATKYITGHSDSSLGAIVCARAELYEQVRAEAIRIGQCAGPEDIHMGLRGLRTLAVRLKQHQESASELAEWLTGSPAVNQVLYPALTASPGHYLWKRDFEGATGVFSIVLNRIYSRKELDTFFARLSLFKLGFSYGGFESLVMAYDPGVNRSKPGGLHSGTILRLQVGLENVSDLKVDLGSALRGLSHVD